jgi:SAM-dependent methyltransferase
MTGLPDRTTFESACAGQAPWDIGKPQRPFLDVAGRISASTLDAGCGTGDTALFLAGRGHQVTGIDFIEEAGRGRGLQRSGGRDEVPWPFDLPELGHSPVLPGLSTTPGSTLY